MMKLDMVYCFINIANSQPPCAATCKDLAFFSELDFEEDMDVHVQKHAVNQTFTFRRWKACNHPTDECINIYKCPQVHDFKSLNLLSSTRCSIISGPTVHIFTGIRQRPWNHRFWRYLVSGSTKNGWWSHSYGTSKPATVGSYGYAYETPGLWEFFEFLHMFFLGFSSKEQKTLGF